MYTSILRVREHDFWLNMPDRFSPAVVVKTTTSWTHITSQCHQTTSFVIVYIEQALTEEITNYTFKSYFMPLYLITLDNITLMLCCCKVEAGHTALWVPGSGATGGEDLNHCYWVSLQVQSSMSQQHPDTGPISGRCSQATT